MVGRMLCPVDNSVLQMTDRQGVEIDYCPQCRGVWLDRGELDKIIERNAQEIAGPVAVPPRAPVAPQRGYEQPERGYEQRPYYGDDDGRHHGHHRPKRRKSFFEELFD